MSHLLIIIFTLSLTAAFTSAFFSYLFYLKNKIRSLKYCVIYNTVLLFHVIIILFRQYIWNAAQPDSFVPLIIIESHFFIWFYLMFIFVPRFFYSIADKPFDRLSSIGFRAISWIPLILLPLPFILFRTPSKIYEFLKFEIVYILNTILGLMIIYMFILMIMNQKKVINPIVKKIIKYIIIFTSIFLPGIVYDLFIRGKLGPNIIINGSLFCALFIFAWNLMTLFFFFKFYSVKINLSFQLGKEIPQSFFTKYNLTNRESEIIQFIVQEKTNVQIGAELFISPRTVDKHIENIYKKTGFNSKADLIAHLNKIMEL